MPLLQLQQVTLSYGSATPILDSVDLQVDPGERVCLLGRNGAGKTSLMRVITGEESPAKGEIIRPAGLSRLVQEVPADVKGKVFDIIHSGVRSDRHEEDWETDVRIEELGEEMGLPMEQEFSTLSGGLKRRVLLARALAGQPDVLLLDEPTNHLDLDAILWMEKFLLEKKFTLFFVTHDRSFLRNLATRIVELDRGRLTSWACDYDTFLERKAVSLEAEAKQWASFDKKLAQEEVWLRQGVRARRTRNEGRVRALEKMRTERGQRREREGKVRMEVQSGALSGQKVIEAKNVTFGYDGLTMLEDFTSTIWRGDKIGIMGPNGGGKTTLLKLLLGKLAPDSGTVKCGTNVQVVYLDQLRGQIDDTKSVAQNVAGDAETVTFQGRSRHIHSYLRDFLFPSDRIRTLANRLSGGERNRLLLARLFLQPANVLVLDEPTNDLDAETLELLEELLVEYDGTLLLVSHDRTFLDNVVTSTLVIEGDGQVGEYVGGYEDWIRAKAVLAAAAANPAPPVQTKTLRPTEKARKFLNREKKELEELPAVIESLEAEQAKLHEKLSQPDIFVKDRDGASKIQNSLSEIEDKLKATYVRWEELEAIRIACEAQQQA